MKQIQDYIETTREGIADETNIKTLENNISDMQKLNSNIPAILSVNTGLDTASIALDDSLMSLSCQLKILILAAKKRIDSIEEDALYDDEYETNKRIEAEEMRYDDMKNGE